MGVQGLNQHKRKYSRRWFETKVKGIVKHGLECEMEDVLDLNKKGRREGVTNGEMFEERISKQKGKIRKITKYIWIHHMYPHQHQSLLFLLLQHGMVGVDQFIYKFAYLWQSNQNINTPFHNLIYVAQCQQTNCKSFQCTGLPLPHNL